MKESQLNKIFGPEYKITSNKTLPREMFSHIAENIIRYGEEALGKYWGITERPFSFEQYLNRSDSPLRKTLNYGLTLDEMRSNCRGEELVVVDLEMVDYSAIGTYRGDYDSYEGHGHIPFSFGETLNQSSLYMALRLGYLNEEEMMDFMYRLRNHEVYNPSSNIALYHKVEPLCLLLYKRPGDTWGYSGTVIDDMEIVYRPDRINMSGN